MERKIKIVIDGSQTIDVLSKVSKASKDSGKNVDKYTRALQKMLNSISNMSSKVADFSTALGRAASSGFTHAIDKSSKSLNQMMFLLGAASATVVKSLGRMKSAIGKLNVPLNTLNRSIRSVKTRMKHWGKDLISHPIRSFTGFVSKLNGALHFLVARFVGLAAGFHSIIEANNLFVNFHATMLTVVHTSAKVDSSWKYLTKTANRLGTSIVGVAGPFARLRAAMATIDTTGELTRNVFTALATATVVLHKSSYDTSLVFLAMEQMASKGKLSLEELQKQLAQKIPGAMILAARAAGYGSQNMAKFYNEIRKGNIQLAPFLKRFAELLRKTYEPGLAIATKNFVALANKLGNTFTELKIKFSNLGFMDGVNNVINALLAKFSGGEFDIAITQLSQTFQSLFTDIANWISGLSFDTINHAIGVVDSMVEGLRTLLVRLLKGSSNENISATLDSIKTGVGDLISALHGLVNFLNHPVKSAVSGFFEAIGNGIVDKLRVVNAMAKQELLDILRSTHASTAAILKAKKDLDRALNYGKDPQTSKPTVDSSHHSDKKTSAAELVAQNNKKKQVIDLLGSVPSIGQSGFGQDAGKFLTKSLTGHITAMEVGLTKLEKVKSRSAKMIADGTNLLNQITSGITKLDSQDLSQFSAAGRELIAARRASLVEVKAGILKGLAAVRAGAAHEVDIYRQKNIDKAEIVRQSFDKFLSTTTHHYDKMFLADIQFLNKKRDANRNFAADQTTFDESFHNAQIRAAQKFADKMSKLGRPKFKTDISKSTDLKSLNSVKASSNTDLADAHQRAVDLLNQTIQDKTARMQAIADIDKTFKDEAINRDTLFNEKSKEIQDQAAKDRLNRMTNMLQAGVDLKQTFADTVSSNNQANLAGMASAMEQFTTFIWKKDKETGKFQVRNEATTWQGKLAIAGSAMKAMSGLMHSGSKKLFMIGKAAAIGSATVDTFTAVNKAMASAPPPYNFILAAIVGAAGIANVAKIASTPFGGKGASASIPTGGASASTAGPPARVKFNPIYAPGAAKSASGASTSTTPSIQIVQHITAPGAQAGQEQIIATAAHIATTQAVATIGQDFNSNGPLRQSLAV